MAHDFCVQRNLTGASLVSIQAAIKDDFKDDTKPKQVQYRFDGNTLVTIKLKTWNKKPFDVKIVEQSTETSCFAALKANSEEGAFGIAISTTSTEKAAKAFFQKVELFTEVSENADADLVRAVNDVVVPFNRDHFHTQAVVFPAPSKEAKVVDADGVDLSVAIANRV